MLRGILTYIEPLFLVIALSVDAFVASFAYGTNRIKMPFASVMIINLVCTLVLALSLVAGSLLRGFIPGELTKILCFLILMALGVVKLFDSTIKSLIRKNRTMRREVSITAFDLKFILTIYADPERADQDASCALSAKEAISLALALSLDGLAVGFGAALAEMNLFLVIAFSLVTDVLAVLFGSRLGNKAAQKLPVNLSWVGGIFLMALALLKLW